MNIDLTPPEQDTGVLEQISDSIGSAGNAFITMHARPDGDALGAAFALSDILRESGLSVEICTPNHIPAVYEFMKRDIPIVKGYPSEKKDLGFILDCSDRKRLEKYSDILSHAGTVINIDHHLWNPMFGHINYVRQTYSSTCEMIFNIAMHMNIDIDEYMARDIYIGILTDTNRFMEENSTPRAHIITAYLVENFVSPVKISSYIYGSNEMKVLKLLSRSIDSLKLSDSKRTGYITVTPEMLSDTDTKIEDLEGIINFAKNIKGVEVGILFRKIPELNGVKVSFRSKGNIDVGKVAGGFGGGGHHNASGCLIEGDFEEAINKIVGAVEAEQ
jgi:phosphoesterase RecJ-like protein